MSQASPPVAGATKYPLKQLPAPRGFGQTARNDNWWVAPLLTFLGLSTFVVYSTWAAFQGKYYWVEGTNYLSPMYAPELWGGSHHAWFGKEATWWPKWLPIAYSAAFLILWAPGGFRFTCYYYRGAYYKAFWQDPTTCGVGEPRNAYRGEQKWPLLFQNIHRYFAYIAIVFIFLLAYDAFLGFWFLDASGKEHFGIGLGTIIMVVNVILLASYTFGCHSVRHIIGGWRDEVTKGPKKAYDCVTCLNRRHMLFAWLSLFTVGFTDVYIRLCSMGIWHDWRIL
jgi:hypothetical protein